MHHRFQIPIVKGCCLTVVCLAIAGFSWGHTVNYALSNAPTNHVVWYYLQLGFAHIIPEGLDHILFVVGLCLLSTRISTILWQATAFTVAHSITLALSLKGIIIAPSGVIEPIIALSILFIAVENLLLSELKPWRIALVFGFGLVHGMGFASALNEVGLPPNRFATSIVAFNVGVELGQVAVIALVFLLVIVPFSKRPKYRRQVVFPLSVGIALMAAFWTVERIINM